MNACGFDGKDSFVQSVLDAIPYPIFVVDEDVRILAFNRTAGSQLEELSDDAILQRSGDVLKCLHANESPLGCGHSDACKHCDIRNTVRESYENSTVCRTRVKFEVLTDGLPVATHLLITASPFLYREDKYVLLTLEDINDLIALRNFVPICAKCKNIRDEGNYWIRLEKYFKDNLNLDFSHAICPDCNKTLYPSLYGESDE
jgi:nitrogen fixation/metabolism regulation signal transduction histidine kinase